MGYSGGVAAHATAIAINTNTASSARVKKLMRPRFRVASPQARPAQAPITSKGANVSSGSNSMRPSVRAMTLAADLLRASSNASVGEKVGS